jgi:multiple sugar transport system substrate-binding protein
MAPALLLVAAACGAPAESPATGGSPAASPAGSPDTGTGATPGAESPAGESPATESPAGESPAGESPAGSPAESPGESPADSPGETAGASPGGEIPGGFSGDLFAFGVTYDAADEIGKVRIDYFRELNPDVNLQVSESDYAPEAFLTQMQSGDPPDVLRVDRVQIAALAARDLLMPLDQCFSDMGVDPAATYYEGALNQVTIDGQIYAAPEFLTTTNWYINDSAFADAGLDPASFDFSDWDAIRSANEQLLQADGQVTRIGIDPKLPEYLPLWVHANGGKLISDDGTTAMFDTPEVAEALQFGVDLITAHGSPSAFLDFRGGWDTFGAENQWATDRAGAHPYENFYLNAILGATPDVDLTVKPFVNRNGEPMTGAAGQGLAITSSTDAPEAACAWVLTMTSDEAWVRAVQERKRIRDEAGEANTGTFTANRVANDRIFGEVLDVSAIPSPFGEAVQVFLDNQENAIALPPTPGAAEIFEGPQSIMAQAVARALEGEDVTTVLADAQAEAQAAIDQAAGQ